MFTCLPVLKLLFCISLVHVATSWVRDPSVEKTMPIRGVQIDFNHLNVTVKKEKGKETTILKDVSGYALPGQLMAIMGPSGEYIIMWHHLKF